MGNKYFAFYLSVFIFFQAISFQSFAENKHSLCIAGSGVYLSESKKFVPGLQLEYEYDFLLYGIELSAIACLEYLLIKEQHFGLGAGLGFSPVKNTEISIGPAIMFEKQQTHYAAFLATSYSFPINEKLSMGPMIELCHTFKEYHLLLGLHISYEFL